MSAADRAHTELLARLQPVVVNAISGHWTRALGPQSAKVTESDLELAADISHDLISALPDMKAGDELLHLRRLHAVWVDGPLRYPGGKDGMYQVACTCGKWRSSPGSTPASASMWEAAREHSRTSRSRDLGTPV